MKKSRSGWMMLVVLGLMWVGGVALADYVTTTAPGNWSDGIWTPQIGRASCRERV